jgi:hypothetical protein
MVYRRKDTAKRLKGKTIMAFSFAILPEMD